jgi:hypothetical protein
MSRWNNPEFLNLDQNKSCCIGHFHKTCTWHLHAKLVPNTCMWHFYPNFYKFSLVTWQCGNVILNLSVFYLLINFVDHQIVKQLNFAGNITWEFAGRFSMKVTILNPTRDQNIFSIQTLLMTHQHANTSLTMPLRALKHVRGRDLARTASQPEWI